MDVKQAPASAAMQASASETLQDDIRRLGRGASIALLGRIGGRGLHLVGQVMLARLLGPAEFGLFALGWTLVHMGSAIAHLGLDQGVVRYGAEFWQKDDDRFRAVLRQSLGLTALFGVTVALILFVTASWLAVDVFQKPDLETVFRWFALALGFATILQVSAAATRVSQRMQFSVLAEDVAPPAVLLLVAGILVGLAGLGLTGATLAAVAGFVAGTGLVFLFLRRLYGWTPRAARFASFPTKELLRFSLLAWLAGIFTMLTLRVDRLLVGYFLPASEVGVYQAASQAAMLSAIILTGFNAIFAPMIARLYHSGELERLSELFKVSTKWGLYVSLPLFLVLTVAPDELMKAVFGEAYAEGAVPMLIMAGAQLFNAATGAVGFMLIMTGHPRRWMVLSAGSLLLNVVFGLVLIPRLGIVGAAIAVGCAVVLLYGGGLVEVRRLLGFWPYDTRYVKGVLTALITFAVLFIVKDMLAAWERVFLLTVLVSISAICFAVGLVILGVDEEDRALLRMLRRRCQ